MDLAEGAVDKGGAALDDLAAACARKVGVPDDGFFFLQEGFDAAGGSMFCCLIQQVHK
jgi:hypothetical protein